MVPGQRRVAQAGVDGAEHGLVVYLAAEVLLADIQLNSALDVVQGRIQSAQLLVRIADVAHHPGELLLIVVFLGNGLGPKKIAQRRAKIALLVVKKTQRI